MIGFFGGSFDPIHFGHISLCLQLLEEHQLKQILFCPAFCSPFKTSSPPLATPEQRLEMVKLAIADIPQFEVTSVEVERGSSSYTIDTIRSLNKKCRLILSNEAAKQLDQWKDVEELVRLAPPLIGPRIRDISSTQIRDRLKKKMYCGHLIPAKTLDYINKHQLYRN